jgi:hypothetical protein
MGDGGGAGDATGVRSGIETGGSTDMGDGTGVGIGGVTVEAGKIQTHFRAVHLRV